MANTSLLYNFWYMAGWADEFDDGLHERTFLNRSVVIFRKSDGDLVALQNRCLHRSFPLASSIQEGDTIRCGYHGVRYNADGQMIEGPPGEDQCPRVSLRTYPMRIAGPNAWIWMGSPEMAAQTPLPTLPWLDTGSDWVTVKGLITLEGNWQLLAENLMDLTHVPFIHNATFKYSRAYAATPIKVERSGDSMFHERRNSPGYHRNGYLRPALSDRLEAAGVQTISRIRFVTPALSIGTGEIHVDNPRMTDQPFYSWNVCNFMTPISDRKTNYWWTVSRNYAHDDHGLTEQIHALNVRGLAEDKIAIELVQKLADADATPFEEIHFKTDAPSLAMRRLVKVLAEREKGQASAVATVRPKRSRLDAEA